MLRYPETRVCLISYLLMYVSVHTDPKDIAQSLLVGLKYWYWSDFLLGDAKQIGHVPSIPNLPFMGFTLSCKISETLTRPLRLTSA